LKLSAALVCIPWVSLAASLSAAAELPAVEAPATAIERFHIVLVGAVRGHGLERLFAEWLEPSGLEVSVVERATLDERTVFVHDEDPSRIRIWITLPAPALARITFADPRAERFLVRDVALEGSLDELGREALAQVLVAAAQAFRERRESTPREEVRRALASSQAGEELPRPAPAAAVPARDTTAPRKSAPDEERARTESASAPSPARLRWAPGARYALRVKGPEGVSHGLGAFLEGGMEWSVASVGLAAEARYEFPHRANAEGVALSISSVALHFGVVAALGSQRNHGWAAEMGTGLERVAIEVHAEGGGGIEPRSDVVDRRALVYAGFGPYFRWRHVRLGLGLRLDVPLAKTHYDVVTDGEATVVLEPWPVQPGAFVTVAWD